MSHLEALKERLKRKPEVKPIQGVRVVLAPHIEENVVKIDIVKQKPFITAEKDEGKRAQEILEKIKQKKLSTVIKKIPEALEPKTSLPSQAPIIEDIKKKKPKRLQDDFIIEEDIEKIPEVLPEGGPRLEEKDIEGEKPDFIVEDQIADVQKEELEFIPKTPRKRTTTKVTKGVIPLGPELMIKIGDTSLPKRLPPIPVFDVKVSSYYMNNR